MSWIFIKILNLSINASWLILAIILLRPLLKKAPKWITCGLWAIVAVRLLFPFSIESALSILPGSEVIPQDIVTTKTPVIRSQIAAVDNVINPVMARVLAPKAGDSANPMQVIAFVAGMIWITGVCICLIYALISYVLLKRRVRASVIISDGVMTCDEIKTPFILGIFRPVIYVPSSLSGRTLEVVLAHEKAHLLRRDHWWKPLGFVLFSVHWFNPLCLIAYVLLCRDVEAACDEKVIRDRDKAFAADYSQALLDLSTSRRIITFCPLAFGESGVKGRVKGILNYRRPAFWVTLFAIVTCVIVAVYFMTSPVTKITKDANGITSITVFDGTCGKELIITDQGEIEKIVTYVNDVKLRRGKISLTYSGYHYRITFQPKKGSWDTFILNSPDLVRKDPFFYSLETETDLGDYLEELYVSHGIKEKPRQAKAGEMEPSASISLKELYGQYICEEPGFPDIFTINLNEDGLFSYYEGTASSYFGGGSWELSGNRVSLKDVNYGEERDFFFTVEDGCLVFDKNASHGFIYTNLADGIRFLRRDNVDDAWIEDLKARGLKKEQERVNNFGKALEEFEDTRNRILSHVNQYPFQGADFSGFVCFDASKHQADVSMPVWIWVENASGERIWQTAIGHLTETQNDYYLYEAEDGTDYLIEYNANSKYHFDMFSLDLTGEKVDELVLDVSETTDKATFNTTGKRYVMTAKLIIGTTGGALSIDQRLWEE